MTQVRVKGLCAGFAVAGLLFTAACSGDAGGNTEEGNADGGDHSQATAKNTLSTDLVLADAVLTAADAPELGMESVSKEATEKFQDALSDQVDEVDSEDGDEGSIEDALTGLMDGRHTEPPQCDPLEYFEKPELKEETISLLESPMGASEDDPDHEYSIFLVRGSGEAAADTEEGTRERATVTLSKHNTFYKKSWYTDCPTITTSMNIEGMNVESHENREIQELDLPRAEDVLAVKSDAQITSSFEEVDFQAHLDQQEYLVQAKVGPYYITVDAEGPRSQEQARELAKKQVEKLYALSEKR